ncbi:DUF4760 domain-containing protein [Gilvimarinus algae]|uniref:DUF4760 domain-containing protein n=1 Tax=Gilvimarinus algae TaxID=3058037 RepID=A0ABT8TG16_9GAMM|nr:DUF4760 domain-containing protein [Gilvimarinus sp. SDUM040014]MDO3383009.1 DUF4760 domain-containing protein [Gilvimarinus sp. SDUM040014]
MIFELLDAISAMALLLISASMLQLVLLKHKQMKAETLSRTQDEIYRSEKMRPLLNRVVRQSQGVDWNMEMLFENAEIREEAFEALNYCEYLCMGIANGIFNEQIIKSFYGTQILIIATHFRRVIKELRYQSNAPDNFRYLYKVAENWGGWK